MAAGERMGVQETGPHGSDLPPARLGVEHELFMSNLENQRLADLHMRYRSLAKDFYKEAVVKYEKILSSSRPLGTISEDALRKFLIDVANLGYVHILRIRELETSHPVPPNSKIKAKARLIHEFRAIDQRRKASEDAAYQQQTSWLSSALKMGFITTCLCLVVVACMQWGHISDYFSDHLESELIQ